MDNYKLIPYNIELHYEILSNWFKQYEWNEPEASYVPKSSYVCFYKDRPIAFSGFVNTDISVAVMSFTIAEKDCDPVVRSECIEMIIKQLFSDIEKKGYKQLHYYSDKNPMVKKMQNMGMTLTDNGDAFILMKAFNNSNITFFAE